MSGKSGGSSSRSSGTSSNAGKRSVLQADHTVHREVVDERLDAIEANAPGNGGRLEHTEDSINENGGRLENIEDMIGDL